MKLVKLNWVDSHSPALNSWVDVDVIDHGLLKIKTVGWIIDETKESITLAGQVAGKGSNQVAGVISIPKSAIVKRKNL